VSTGPQPSDAELVGRAKGGDRAAFGQLAERYYRMVSVLAFQKVRNRADAEDAVQESFVRAYRALESLREAEKFGGWLCQIALKICLDHGRKKGRHEAPVPLDEKNQADPAAREAPALAAMEAEEEQNKVARAIASLPDKYRIVVTLRYVEKKSYKEIAALLGEPDGTVANRIHRAVKMLQGVVEGVPSDMGAVGEEAEA
jgi:RNA polymerase sigma-70 factor (ECF subfamily)